MGSSGASGQLAPRALLSSSRGLERAKPILEQGTCF